ncbi:FecCD family ABC transporter permease [Fischerella thermalis]|jgi:iron complex transport system permease protein|uniref:FecCD family ABC transporter permease n=1 Tax=Fischerella thermalis TaxID=372787 RepID=UPI0002F9238E|nr:iron ABC transporter permease [Fischerella thermalis]PMB09842.1 iron ABC transporter permease [Fischerella thermalis CCMEE 5328]PLZ27406.1 iron ABC transporter permease [Fischerella thermalis WC341]PMB13215.1 iron ABC transporter permease [Fischerella thermalis CCMEE 5282]PMB30232.1 iron ABC transporter permease [Fischerella thermalis CCMEE 5208]PMB34897.1 iron ABC transporter permease [Fischerella thermalis BR2B]
MTKATTVSPRGLKKRQMPTLLGLVLGLCILLICLVYSVTLGAADIPLDKILASFIAFDGSYEHLVVQTVRLPRVLIAILVGSALAVSGALMQGLTRNPLADPGILGIESGAALAVVATIFIFGSSSLSVLTIVAFLGAGVTATLVYFLGSLGRGGATPLNLTVAGAALTALISSLTTAVLILSQRTLEEIRFWLAGSLAGRDSNILLQALPFVMVGLVVAFALGRQITTMSLGEDVAKGLGQKTAWIKIVTAISVVLLAGSSVALAGPIGFIGLVVPHMVKFYIKADYRWILPYSAVLGAILLLVADIAARLLLKPQELPVGVMTALIGAPFFVYLAKSKVKK